MGLQRSYQNINSEHWERKLAVSHEQLDLVDSRKVQKGCTRGSKSVFRGDSEPKRQARHRAIAYQVSL